MAEKKKDKFFELFQKFGIIFLAFLWVGYFYALYSGNENNMNSYTISILIFSLFNADVLMTRAKMENKVLNAMAKVEGILLVVVAIITIVLLLLK